MTTVARAQPGQNQELGASSRSPTWVAGVQTHGPSSAFPCSVRSGTAGIQVGVHTQEVGIVNGGSTYYVTMPAPVIVLFLNKQMTCEE